jgi:type II secretory ATPase GspE/PulE/Tfp pilus assembly ATPase PilB-like protein
MLLEAQAQAQAQEHGAPRFILTIEEPVEHPLDGISQLALNPKAGLTLAEVLRRVLRMDPDLILVSGTRDLESLEGALRGAATGHLVLTAFHCLGAIGIIRRIRDMGCAAIPTAGALAGLIGQCLVRRVCAACRTEYEPDPEALARISLSPQDGPFHHGSGCKACFGTGFRGRVGLCEVLEVEEPLRGLIAEDAPPEALWQESFGRNGGSLPEDARDKVRLGITTAEEVRRGMYYYSAPKTGRPERAQPLLPVRTNLDSSLGGATGH